jgi:hypothetical protein
LSGLPGAIPRKTLAVLLTAAAAATPAAAPASSQFRSKFKTTFLTRETGASTGLRTRISWSDPGAPNGVPKVIREIDLRFPRGTRIDTYALPRCPASDATIMSTGASACPPASELGSGHTIGVFASGMEFTTKVTAFNAERRIIILATLNGAPITVFRDLVHKRAILVRPALPPGVALRRLSLRMGAFSTGAGSMRRIYMRTPRQCPASGSWTIEGHFTYVDGSQETLTRASRCRAAKHGQ